MTRGATRGWFLVHKWTSLICTAFLLLLCVTGLPLIFHDEIDVAFGHHPAAGLKGPSSWSDTGSQLSLDVILSQALARRPGEVPLFMAFDNRGPLVTVTTGPRPDTAVDRMTLLLFDRTTGAPVGQGDDSAITSFLLQLHTDLFLGLPGMFLLGAMALLFVAALVSGAVLYAPFMRKLPFGTLRTRRSARLRWLDTHNLLGITALAWMLVVGVTGAINAFAKPIIGWWQATELAEMTAAYANRPALPPGRYSSLDRAMAAAQRALPGNRPQFIAFPGGAFSSRHHYAIFFQGASAMTERLLTPVLVDAETGALTDARPMPWYAQALLLSQPLHFGDYGGLPMKLLWAVLDGFTIMVLGSGLYLWARRRPAASDAIVGEIATGGRTAPQLSA